MYYDYANSSEASIKILRTILNLLLKHSIDQQNRRRTWFFLDEASLLPETCIADAMSLGREQGFRLFMCLQSAQLMTRHYKEEEAKTLLSLFPNVICMKVQDAFSRRVVAERYGKNLCSYSFSAPMQKVIQHVSDRPVVADFDFSQIGKKGDAICSIPNLSMVPFFIMGIERSWKRMNNNRFRPKEITAVSLPVTARKSHNVKRTRSSSLGTVPHFRYSII